MLGIKRTSELSLIWLLVMLTWWLDAAIDPEDEIILNGNHQPLIGHDHPQKYQYAHHIHQFQNSMSHENCCEKPIIITSSFQSEGYLKAPPLYEELTEPKNAKKTMECLYKFYGKPNERIQLFYEDFDLYYPYDIYKFLKIEYSDSICLKFYEQTNGGFSNNNVHNKQVKTVSLKNNSTNQHKIESVNIEAHNYDICNCINVSFTPRQIMSAGNFIQVRFKTVQRSSSDMNSLSTHPSLTSVTKRPNRGYIIRYKFITDFGIDMNESGLLDKSGDCKVYFNSSVRRDGYFSSPNYPGLYPRDVLCHYYFFGSKQAGERVQITFHTFDVEGVDQCTAETKSDYVELSNFQNRDRKYHRFCGINKPGSVLSENSFFHVVFYSNNVFDGKGFEASYHFISSDSEIKNNRNTAASSAIKSVDSSSSFSSSSGAVKRDSTIIIFNCISVYLVILANLYINH